jgi:sugar/nucleoside kinase (ribokinase family)
VLVDLGPRLFGRPDLPQLTRLVGPLVYLTMNEAELAGLTECRYQHDGLRKLHDIGFARVVIKLGPRGALVSTAPGPTGWRVVTEALPFGPRSTVGAGDSFNAGLVYGLLSGFDICRSAALGNRVAWRALSGPELGPSSGAELISHLDHDPEPVQEV